MLFYNSGKSQFNFLLLTTYFLHTLLITFQGKFTEWLDGSPLLNTAWLQRSASLPQYKSSVYAMSKGKTVEKQTFTHINVSASQPDTNKDANCTAVHIGMNLHHLTWIAIPCDKPYEATFVCPKPVARKPVNFPRALNPRDVTCQDGWMQMKGYNKCQMLLKTPTETISYVETQQICSAMGGSVFAVNPAASNDPPTHTGKQLVGHLQITFRHKTNVTIPRKYTDPATLLEFFFGQHVNQATLKKTLASMIFYAENGDLAPLTFMVTISEMCGILTFSKLGSHFQKPSDNALRWGVKYRRCLQNLTDVTAIICEKPLSNYSLACKKDYFQCADYMCILSIYVCDKVSDCFDGSDELMCSNGTMWNITVVNKITISSILTDSDNSESDIYVPVHAICDGVNLYNIIHLQEICVTTQPIHIDVLAMQSSKKFGQKHRSRSLDVHILWDMYQSEMSLRTLPENVTLLNSTTPNETKTITIEKYQVPCTWKGEQIELENRCKISVRKNVCDYSDILNICKDIQCPGMFKCDQYYCLHMSAVCDGHSDCQYGEDEKYCRNMTCPGLLKCRGEKRCVSDQEICDGNSDCLVSRDDEIMCGRCVEGCECNVYTALCDADKFMFESGELTHIKGLVLQTTQSQLRIKNLDLTALIYINVSHTAIEVIHIYSSLASQSIMFADFYNNNIQSTTFLYITLFDNLIYLNLRQNLLTHFGDKEVQLSYLTLLDLSQNPLRVVDLNLDQIMKRLQIIKIEFVQFYHNINFKLTSSSLNTIHTHVTDSILCCLLSQNIKCKIDNSDSSCQRLVNETFKLYFYCLAVGATISSLITLVVHIATYHKTSKILAINYIMSITNRLIADVICSIYLICLAVADLMHVETIKFRTGSFCILMNGLCFIAFEVCIVFKTYHVISVVLKTIFPFKHQCRWLRLTVIKSSFPWIILITLYIVIIFHRLRNNGVFLDQVCSFADCHTYTRYTDNILLAMSTVIHVTCLVVMLASMISFVLSMKRNSIFLNQGKERIPFKIVLKLYTPLCIDILIRLYIAYVYFINVLATLSSEYKCIIIFIVLIPINIITSCLFNLLIFTKLQ